VLCVFIIAQSLDHSGSWIACKHVPLRTVR
jgi:hypothetical protein